MSKTLLRKQYTLLRNNIPPEDKIKYDNEITQKISKILDRKKNKVAIFYPKKTEINLLELQILRPDIIFLLPRIKDDKLIFLQADSLDNLELNQKYNIYEPYLTSKNIIPDTIICPMLAFDTNRNRLGYGGGYYDRTISQLKLKHKIQLIGVAYSIQQNENLPTSEQDEQLDLIITETKIGK